MKYLHNFRWLLLGSLLSLLMLPGVSMATIVGSGHDFTQGTNSGWAQGANGDDEICIACHTPHNGINSFTLAPLWNSHALTAVTNYTLYNSVTDTLDATLTQPTSNNMTKLCLSCHDGTVALDSFGGTTGSTTMTGDANFGTNLNNDHPIAFTYSQRLIDDDGELHQLSHEPSIAGWPGGSTIEDELLFGATAGLKTVECASCHDVHNGANITPLLRYSNSGSGLCLACHDK